METGIWRGFQGIITHKGTLNKANGTLNKANGIQYFNQQIIKQGNFPGLFKLTQLNYRGPKNVEEGDG